MRVCPFCKQKFEGFGHNPEPILGYDERCCNECNMDVVVPVRIFGLENQQAIAALKKHGFAARRKKSV